MRLRIVDKRDTWQFHPSSKQADIANIVGAAVTLSCAGICLATLSLAIFLYCKPKLRHHFNKTSTQLLYVCLLLMLPYGVSYASTSLHLSHSEAAFCNIGMVVVIFCYNAASWLQCCICLNLVLALKWPALFQYNIAKWYYITAFISAAVLAVLPSAFSRVGWSARMRSCWIKASSDGFNDWQLGVLEIPILLVTLFMFVSAGIVGVTLRQAYKDGKSQDELLSQLYKPSFITNVDDIHVLSDTNMTSRFSVEEMIVINPASLEGPPKTLRSDNSSHSSGKWSSHKVTRASVNSQRVSEMSKFLWSGKGKRPGDKSLTGTSGDQRSSTNLKGIKEESEVAKVRVARMPTTAHFGSDPRVEDAKKLRMTILRICSYPVIHLLIAVSSPIGSLLLMSAEHSSESYKFGLYLLTYIGTAGLPLAYVLCALGADTSIYDAWTAHYKAHYGRDTEDLETVLGKDKHRLSGKQVSVMADHSSVPIDTPRKNSPADIWEMVVVGLREDHAPRKASSSGDSFSLTEHCMDTISEAPTEEIGPDHERLDLVVE